MRDINNCFTKKEKRRRRKKALTRVIKQRAREIGRLRCLPRERSIHEEHVLSYFPLKLYDSPYIGTCVSYPVKLGGRETVVPWRTILDVNVLLSIHGRMFS